MNVLPVHFRGALTSVAASLLFLFCTTVSFAQESDPFVYESHIVASPEAYEMSKHGNLKPNLNTGAMTYSLPLYTYQDKDFYLPVSLEYNYDGYRPDSHSGCIGMGWRLNCGGIITREIVGFPDDYNSVPSEEYLYDGENYGADTWGYYFSVIDTLEYNAAENPKIRNALRLKTCFNPLQCTGQRSPLLLNAMDLSGVLGATPFCCPDTIVPYMSISSHGTNVARVPGPLYDPSSDIYHFTLPNCSGDFIIREDGSIKVFNSTIPEGEVTVSMLVKKFTTSLSLECCQTMITITLSDGHRYEFGGDVYHIDYTYEANTVGVNTPGNPNRFCFSALHLSRIITPNGRVLSIQRDTVNPYLNMVYRPAPQIRYTCTSPTDSILQSAGMGEKLFPTVLNNMSRLIQSVSVDQDTVIRFIYVDKEKGEFSRTAFAHLTDSKYNNILPNSQTLIPLNPNNPLNKKNRLSSVLIHNSDGVCIDSLSLSQIYTSDTIGHSSKMFLQSVSGNYGTYRFEYNNADTDTQYPPIDGNSTDHWGYWSATSAYNLDNSHRQWNSLYDLPLTGKEPDSVRTMYGVLRKIIYPSGGWSKIDYECNRVSHRLDISLDSLSGYRLDTCSNYIVGGVRVRRIISNSGKFGSFQDTTDYYYCNSGTLLSMPRYYVLPKSYFFLKGILFWGDESANPAGPWGMYSLELLNDRGLPSIGTSNHVQYSHVKTGHGDGSHSEQFYCDWLCYSDSFLHDRINTANVIIKPTLVICTWDESDRLYYFSAMADNAILRQNAKLSNAILCDHSCIRGKIKKARIFDASNSLVKESRYSYSIDTSATTTVVHNCYSNYLVADRIHISPRLDSMITIEYLPGGGALSDTTLYTYNDLGQQTVIENRGFDGDVRRSRLRYEHEADTSATAPKANVSDVVTTRLFFSGTTPLEYITSLNHYDYDTDSARRHLPIKAKNYGKSLPWIPAVSSSDTLWFSPLAPCDTLVRTLSYDGKQRPSILSMPGNAYLSFVWDTAGRYVLSREENGPAMKSYYTWKDMVGLTQLKSPTGRSEWYSYDEKNRLSEVYRADSVLVKEYDYHIYSEDTTLGPSSIKQTIWRTADKNNREIAYYDGLGYPIQTVRTSTQVTGGHIVTPISYDALRRDDVRAYLPYQASQSAFDSTAFTKQKNYYKTRFNQDTLAYTEKEYGTSQAGRLLSVRQPGKAYADSSKKIVYEYRTNNAEDSILDLSVTVSAQPQLTVAAGYLPSGKLLLTKTTDEDGCTSEVFTNSAGKTILSRQRTGGQRLDTYYVYDLRDSLVCVLQPEGAALIAQNASYNILQPVTVHSMATLPTTLDNLLEKYAFLYAYDSWGRLRLKKKPGAAPEEFVLDDRGRVALSRDGNLRDSSKWLFNEYDAYDALTRRSLTNLSVGLDTLWKAMTFRIDSSQILLRDTVRIWAFLLDNDPDAPRYVYSRMLWPAAGDTLLSADGDYLSVSEGRGIDDLGSYTLVGSSHYYTTGNSILLDPEWGWQIDEDWQAIFADALTNKTLLEEHLYNRGNNPAIPQNLAFQDVTGIVSQADLSSSLNLEVWQRQMLLPPERTIPGGSLNYVERAFWYDTLGTLVQTVETNALGGISRTSAKYDYLRNVILSEEKHTIAGSNTPTVKRMSFNYDKQGRIASEGVTVNGNAATTGTLFDYDLMGRQTYAGWSAARAEMVEIMSYDICGRLTDKETSRTWNEAGEEEAERGRWSITGVATTLDTAQAVIPLGNRNGDDGEEQEPEEPDLPADQLVFKQHLKYFNPTEQSSQPRWNGLISEIAHQRTDTGTVITNGYFYDHAGRLTDHIRYDGSSQTNRYTERDLSFDRNGNILTLKRYGTNVAAPQDNLTYTYEGNKLMQLNGATYQYDSNGNMTHDGRRGLDLSWNHLNLPSSICSDEDEDALVNYTYLADGTKVLAEAPGTSEGYAYLGTMVYKLNNGSWVLETTPFTGGRFIANATGGMDEYRYITDHLGSTRVIVTGTDYHEVEHNDYYPFGMRIADSSLPTVASNRWRFSGKEIQTLGNIELVDFGARLYDYFRGQWPTQDALSEKHFGLSPYNYCSCNPINLIDYMGMDIWELDEEGRILSYRQDTNQDAVYLVERDSDGNYKRKTISDSNGNLIEVGARFDYGTIESVRSISFSPDNKTVDTYDVYQIRGDENGKALFSFLSDNITAGPNRIEFGLAMTGSKGENGLDFITTSHTPRKEYGQVELFNGQLVNGYTIRELWHSHPESFWASNNDISFKNGVINNMKLYDQRAGLSRNVPYFIVYTALYHFPITFTIKP